jgi:hypothetical protein
VLQAEDAAEAESAAAADATGAWDPAAGDAGDAAHDSDSHVDTPELASEALLDAACVLLRERVERSFRADSAAAHVRALAVAAAAGGAEAALRTAFDEITAAARQGTPSAALKTRYRTAEARSSRAQSLKGKLNLYLASLDDHIAGLKRAEKRPARRNSATAEGNRRDFAGSFSGYKELYFPEGTPKEGLSTLGPLVLIRTEAGDIKPAGGTAVLCQDAAGKLYIGAKQAAPLIDGGARNFGHVRRVEYVCSKPHLGYPGKITWFHDFENPLPTLKSDGKGGLHFHGGGYTIRREGIVG